MNMATTNLNRPEDCYHGELAGLPIEIYRSLRHTKPGNCVTRCLPLPVF